MANPMTTVSGINTGDQKVPWMTTVQTDSGGNFTVPMPAGRFAAAPVCLATVLCASTRPHSVTFSSVDPTSLTGRVSRVRTLPNPLAVLTALVGYDVMEPPGVATVHVLAYDPA